MTYKAEDVENEIEKLEKIKKKLSKNTKLNDSEKNFLNMHLNPAKLEKEPPFSITNLLHYCWSLSLNLSGKPPQRELGKTLTGKFLEFLKRYSLGELTIDKPPKGFQLVNERFVNDLLGSFSKTIRNIGFVKDAHDRKLDDLETELKSKTKFWDELSNLASVTKEGLGSKIIAFVGGGSLITLTKNLVFLQNPEFETQFTRLEKLYKLAPNDETKAQIFANATDLMKEFPPSVSNFDILLFALAGAVFVVSLTIGTKLLRHRAVNRLFGIIRKNQQDYWEKRYRPEVAEYLLEFYFDIKALIQKYYKHNSNEILKEFSDRVKAAKIRENSSKGLPHEPLEEDIKDYIEQKILPHYWIQHGHENDKGH